MMMRKVIFFLTFILLFRCTNIQRIETGSSVPVITVELPYKKSNIDFNDITKNLSFIQLETNSECLLKGVRKVEIFDNRIYIFDSHLCCFDLQGKFLYTVGSRGNGPGEYVFLADFILDKENECLWLGDGFNKLLKYDLDGNFITQYNTDFSVNNIFLVDEKESIMAIRLGSYKGKNYSFITYSINKNKVIYYKESKNARIINSIGGPTMSKSNEKNIYTEPLNDTIFIFSKDGIEPYYRIDFGKKKIPKTLFEDYPQLRDILPQINNPDNQYAGLVMNPYVNSDYLFFSYRFSGKQQLAIYSFKSNKLLNINDILFMGKLFECKGNFFHVQNDNQFIAFLPANLLAEGSTSLQGDKRQGYGSYSDITKLIPNLDEEDNPVMVMGEFNLDHLFQ